MPRRLDVDETLSPVAVPRPIVQELMLHAREADPDECCGLIVGDEGERYRRTVRCTNAMTQMHKKDPKNYPRDARQAFFIDPREWLEVHYLVDSPKRCGMSASTYATVAITATFRDSSVGSTLSSVSAWE